MAQQVRLGASGSVSTARNQQIPVNHTPSQNSTTVVIGRKVIRAQKALKIYSVDHWLNTGVMADTSTRSNNNQQ
jgi:hypothetical protein